MNRQSASNYTNNTIGSTEIGEDQIRPGEHPVLVVCPFEVERKRAQGSIANGDDFSRAPLFDYLL